MAPLFDLDLPRARRLVTLHRDLQDSVSVGRVHPVGVGVLGKRDDPPEVAVKALLPVVAGFVISLDLAAAGNGQQVLLDRHVDRPRIRPGSEYIDVDALGRRTDIDRGVSAPRDGPY